MTNNSAAGRTRAWLNDYMGHDFPSSFPDYETVWRTSTLDEVQSFGGISYNNNVTNEPSIINRSRHCSSQFKLINLPKKENKF